MGRPLYPNYPHKGGDVKAIKKGPYDTETKPIFEQEAVEPVAGKGRKRPILIKEK